MAINLILTGFMGTGKTTVGRILAERLDREFVDTDAVIEERHGPITEIFRVDGEEAFRAIERSLADELATRQGLVISTGGRLMLDTHNAEVLGRTGRVFCLVASVDEILERVTGDPERSERPLLAVADPRRRIIELLEERSNGYGRFSQIVTSGRHPGEIADEIAEQMASPTAP